MKRETSPTGTDRGNKKEKAKVAITMGSSLRRLAKINDWQTRGPHSKPEFAANVLLALKHVKRQGGL